MKKELKDKWVAALRSGNYQQCKGVLKGLKHNSYCCLGVLCDVNGDAWEDRTIGYGLIQHDGSWTEHLDLLGVDGSDRSDLINMNDFQDKTFDEIADWIEINIKGE